MTDRSNTLWQLAAKSDQQHCKQTATKQDEKPHNATKLQTANFTAFIDCLFTSVYSSPNKNKSRADSFLTYVHQTLICVVQKKPFIFLAGNKNKIKSYFSRALTLFLFDQYFGCYCHKTSATYFSSQHSSSPTVVTFLTQTLDCQE